MPKLVQKCGYIRNGSAAKYMRYIATREGVEKLHGRGPVTQPQKELIERLLKDYPDKEGSEIIQDNCQDTIFGGFAPGSQTAEVLSKNLGTRTVQSGSVSQSKNDPSQSLQMVERPLMTPDELRSIPKGHFVVMKTGCHPMQTRLRLFLEWGITFEKEGYTVPARENAQVHYAGRKELEDIVVCHCLHPASLQPER